MWADDPTLLCRYGITPDFKDFVRSLTYSTFRDFPTEELEEPAKDAAVTGSTAPALTPWQVRGCATNLRWQWLHSS